MKRKFAILLVLVLALSACAFSLAACDEEPEEVDRFALYGIDRLITEYEYYYTDIEWWNEEYNGWYDVASFDALKTLYDIQHYIGDNPYVLEMQEFIKTVGGQIRVGMEETDFSGELGEMPSDLMPLGDGEAYLELQPATEQESEIPFGYEMIYIYHNITPQNHPTLDIISLTLWHRKEIDGRMCRFEIVYCAECDCRSN